MRAHLAAMGRPSVTVATAVVAFSSLACVPSGFEVQGTVDTTGLQGHRRALVVFLLPDPAVDSSGRPSVRPGSSLYLVAADQLAPSSGRPFRYTSGDCALRSFAMVAWSPRMLPLGLAEQGSNAGSSFAPASGDPVVFSPRRAVDCSTGEHSVDLVLPVVAE